MLAHTLAVHSQRRQEEKPVKWEYYAQHYHGLLNHLVVLARSQTQQHVILPTPVISTGRYPDAQPVECARYVKRRLREEHGFFVKVVKEQMFISWDPDFVETSTPSSSQVRPSHQSDLDPSTRDRILEWLRPAPTTTPEPEHADLEIFKDHTLDSKVAPKQEEDTTSIAATSIIPIQPLAKETSPPTLGSLVSAQSHLALPESLIQKDLTLELNQLELLSWLITQSRNNNTTKPKSGKRKRPTKTKVNSAPLPI